MMTNYHRLIKISIMLFKTFRLVIVIAHLRILRLIIITFIQRYINSILPSDSNIFYYYF
jgi:hypothetical protein